MSKTPVKLKPLAMSKQLLQMESELNRIQFVAAVEDWQAELHRSKQQFTELGTLVTKGMKIAATVSTARRLFSQGGDHGKTSWRSLLFNGLKMGASLWLFMRSRR
jgi:hypothetical protein